jgi:hypothetical protein
MLFIGTLFISNLCTAVHIKWVVWAAAHLEGGHDGVAHCETADRFVNSASPRVAPPKSFTCSFWPETLQARTRAAGARRSGLARCGAAAVCSTAGARLSSGEERAALRRGRPRTRGGDELRAPQVHLQLGDYLAGGPAAGRLSFHC